MDVEAVLARGAIIAKNGQRKQRFRRCERQRQAEQRQARYGERKASGQLAIDNAKRAAEMRADLEEKVAELERVTSRKLERQPTQPTQCTVHERLRAATSSRT